MALVFVFGTMNLAAAVALNTLVLAEKVLPHGFAIARVAGVGPHHRRHRGSDWNAHVSRTAIRSEPVRRR
jgi:hypothetical protein